ncbi:MAG: cobalamin biosynthesis protein CobQ [Patescibacteria group bacterium]|nr:cobalamin biosynthesis protein CobQ [Patescibacteria group bacterium]
MNNSQTKNQEPGIKNYTLNAKRYALNIGWIYPKLMNVYGDRGNIITLQKRCEWRDIEVETKYLDAPLLEEELEKCDLLMMGGAQDEQQEIVSRDLKKKSKALKSAIEKGIPGLYVCGAYQFLGNYYKEADGTEIPGLGIFDLHTINPGRERLIGNLIANSDSFGHLIGFENHGGRTYLGKNIKPLARVIKGFGNNGDQPAMQDGKALQAGDKTEGAVYKNSIGTYFHGPILPKNPELADYLIKTSLKVKYKEDFELKKLDDSIAENARKVIAKRLSIAI